MDKKSEEGKPQKKLLAFGMLTFGGMLAVLFACLFLFVLLPYLEPKPSINKLVDASKEKNHGRAYTLMMEAWNECQEDGVSPNVKSSVMLEVVKWMHQNGEHEKALKLYEEAATYLKSINRNDELAETLTLQADSLARLNKASEAITPIEKACELRADYAGAETAASIYTLSIKPEVYLGAGKLDDASKAISYLEQEASKSIRTLAQEDLAHYRAIAEVEKAQLLAIQKDLPKSELAFKRAVRSLDVLHGPGQFYSELALLQYAKTLKHSGADAQADFYNDKLDKPMDFTDSDWESRAEPWERE